MSKTYCIFSANYLPNIGGVERYTQNLAYALADKGNRVIIVTSNVFDLARRECLREGVEIVRLPCHNILKGRLPLPKKDEAYRGSIEYLEKQHLDAVVVNTRFYPHSLAGMALAERKGIVPIVIDHGSAHLTMGNSAIDTFVSAYEHIITTRIKRHKADYYAVSSAGVQWLRHFDIEARGVLSNSIDAQQFRDRSSGRDYRSELGLEPSVFTVSFVGRLIPEKGIHALVEGAKLLAGEKDIHFLLVGDGPLEGYIAQQHLPAIHMLGKRDADDISALLQDADVFCLPTRSEGFSTSLLEAAACGATPIITEVGGVAELMPSDDYGMLLKKADAEEIAEKIMLLKQDPALNNRLAVNIRQRVETSFSWSDTAQHVIEACDRANER